MTEIPKLYYFPFYARAEAIRMLLSYLNVEYQQCMIGMPYDRSPFEFGQIPDLQIDGKMLGQSKAILYYLAQKYGLMPSEPDQIIQLNFIGELFGEMRAGFRDLVVRTPDPAKTKRIFFQEVVPQVLNEINSILEHKQNQDFLIGSKLTVADVWINDFIWSTMLNPTYDQELLKTQHTILKKYVLVEKYAEKRKEDFKRLIERPASHI